MKVFFGKYQQVRIKYGLFSIIEEIIKIKIWTFCPVLLNQISIIAKIWYLLSDFCVSWNILLYLINGICSIKHDPPIESIIWWKSFVKWVVTYTQTRYHWWRMQYLKSNTFIRNTSVKLKVLYLLYRSIYLLIYLSIYLSV